MLNATQKKIIQSTVNFYIEGIVEDLKPQEALKVFNAILSPVINDEDMRYYKKLGIDDCIEAIRKILLHPYPQNRSENYPRFGRPADPSMIVYKNIKGEKEFENKGLLSLTSRNDNKTSPPTKEDVVKYIFDLINQEISNQKNNLPKTSNYTDSTDKIANPNFFISIGTEDNDNYTKSYSQFLTLYSYASSFARSSYAKNIAEYLAVGFVSELIYQGSVSFLGVNKIAARVAVELGAYSFLARKPIKDFIMSRCEHLDHFLENNDENDENDENREYQPAM